MPYFFFSQGLNLDLTADLQPPKELHVEVRVLNDCGEIMTDHVRPEFTRRVMPVWLEREACPFASHACSTVEYHIAEPYQPWPFV